MIYTMQKTRTESWDPIIKMEFTVTWNITELAQFGMNKFKIGQYT